MKLPNFFLLLWVIFALLAKVKNGLSNIWAPKKHPFIGSRQPERGGVRNVSNDHNLSRTAAIDVLFSFNFAVVFDFIYFRFRPSKAK
jgi:hypothetical protein